MWVQSLHDSRSIENPLFTKPDSQANNIIMLWTIFSLAEKVLGQKNWWGLMTSPGVILCEMDPPGISKTM